MKVINVIVLTVVLIGALNRGAIGFFDFNAVLWLANIIHPAITDVTTAELMVNPLVEKCSTIIYDVVGISGIILILCKIFVRKK